MTRGGHVSRRADRAAGQSTAPAAPPEMSMLDVCFVAPLAHGALVDAHDAYIGGVERQTRLMARWLASRGHRVTAITWDEGQPDEVEVRGVRLLKLCRRDAGVPGLRFVHPRWTSLIGALRRADASVYYQNSSEYVTGQVALWCRQRGRAFVFSAASDNDCVASLPYLATLRERALYRYGLRHADRRIVQTRTQQRMLRAHFGLESAVIPMPCAAPVPAHFPEPPAHTTARLPRVLWVGRLTPEKRPDRLLDLAAACPEIQFDLVGPAYDVEYSRQILARARRQDNVVVHGAVLPGELPAFYGKALCLCCTSESEGFPNTFLEAWALGLPTITCFDPDGIIARERLGERHDTYEAWEAALERWLGDAALRRESGARARDYATRVHGAGQIHDRMAEMLEALLARRRARG